MVPGDVVPRPRRALDASQKKLALSWASWAEEFTKSTEPDVPFVIEPPIEIDAAGAAPQKTFPMLSVWSVPVQLIIVLIFIVPPAS